MLNLSHQKALPFIWVAILKKTTLLSTVNFEGDRHGEFKGNFVAVLSDDSKWKIHPKDSEKYSTWQLEDNISCGIRDTRYWFEQEHKFELYNTTRRQSVRAMLVAPSLTSTAIIVNIEMQDPVSVVRTRTDYNDRHKQKNTYYKTIYKTKVLRLSNGSKWSIDDPSDFDEYQVGSRVLIGVSAKGDKRVSFFIVHGKEREAVWTWCTCQRLPSSK